MKLQEVKNLLNNGSLAYKVPDKTDQLVDSLENINKCFFTIHEALSVFNLAMDFVEPAYEVSQNYKERFEKFVLLDSKYNLEYKDFVTTVQSYSAKWLQPLSINYPTLLQEPLGYENISDVANWLRTFFPIRNSDGTLNYAENQLFIVNCYTYSYEQPVDVLAQPYSYCNCETQTGDIYLHCKTKITGGTIHCNQGNYNCDKIIDCYPKKTVDCWYEMPYLHLDSTKILPTDALNTKQLVISKIQANITMKYTDRRENTIKSFKFKVYNCDWDYVGEVKL